MREILFRGKRKDNGKWVEGYYAKRSNHACFAYELRYNHFIIKDIFMDYNLGVLQEFEIIPETAGQYTGLTDKNGKKIFEGDLCLCNRNINDRFDKAVFVIKYDELIGFYGENEWGGNTISADEFGMCEIFGNVFDNPELLEVNKNDK